jgi:membrane-associated phospholipid phosphatase
MDRILACWRGKLLMLLVLAPVLDVCYLLPQWLPLRPAGRLPLTPIDRAVPFDPNWVYPYLSLYPMLILPPLLATRPAQLWRYTIGAVLMFLAATIVFLIWPIEYPRPPLPHLAPAAYRLVTTIDRPLNSIPSLHAGLVAYSLLFAARVLSDVRPGIRRLSLGLLALWGAVILYATLATRQHYLLDLPPGLLLAWAADRLAWRATAPPRPASATNREGEAPPEPSSVARATSP